MSFFSCCLQPTQRIKSDTERPGADEFGIISVGDVGAVDICKPQKDLLDGLISDKPYLLDSGHEFFNLVTRCQEALKDGNADDAQAALDRLALEVTAEEKAIGAAFMKFDSSGDGVLSGTEIQFMLDYLGFPCTTTDVKQLLEIIDVNADQSVSFSEFLNYVGALGGSSKLFEVRRQQIMDRGGFTTSHINEDTMQVLLQQCGIQEEAQEYWKLVASVSELESAAELLPPQKTAVRHIRNLSKENHDRAMPFLQERVKKLGFTDVDLFMALAWIRELAPILVHINLDKVGQFLRDDTHYRNQFETNTSSGLLKHEARIKWERGLFGSAYEGAEPFCRPKYGVQNVWNDYRGVLGCKQYGDSYLVLKDVRLRCTFSPEDSANMNARQLSVLDYYAHNLLKYSDKELHETLRVAASGDERVGDSHLVQEKWGKYKEVQIHGEVAFDKHVERLVVNERHRGQEAFVNSIGEAHGWKITWMNEMKTELQKREHGREMAQEEWQTKLNKFKDDMLRSQAVSQYVDKDKKDDRKAVWEYAVRSVFHAFDGTCQVSLEEQYQTFLAKGEPKVAKIPVPGRKVTITVDFITMVQKVDGASVSRMVRRREVASGGMWRTAALNQHH